MIVAISCDPCITINTLRGIKSAELSSLVVWLLEQCGSQETSYRQQCMMLLVKFTTLLPGEHHIELLP